MAGETNLKELLGGMRPMLRPDVFVFATVPSGQPLPAGLQPVMTFHEAEGMTVIVEESRAHAARLAGTFRCRLITLEVHSSLESVGFLAAVTRRLADAGIGVNAVSAFFHDHLFVPADRAEQALAILRRLSSDARDGAG